MRRFLLTLILISTTVACAPDNKKTAAPQALPQQQQQEESLHDVASPEEVAEEIGIEAPPEVAPLETGKSFFSLEKQIEVAKVDVLQHFPVVIVVNKATKGLSAQTMKVYHRGVLAHSFKVSTGRERQELAKSGRSYFSVTPVGWFAPTKTVEKYFSNTWKAYMDYSVFFIGGVALHATTKDHYKELGTRASGGCVRLERNSAKLVYDLILSEGKGEVPVFTRDGKIARDVWGNVKTKKSWNTLIIVENTIEE